MGETLGVSAGLRWAWAVGGVVLAAGAVLSLDGAFVVLFPGLAVLSVVGGATAARGRGVGVGWLLLAWSMTLLPGVGALVAFAYLASVGADPLAVVLLVFVTVPLWVGVLVVFALALVVELARLHVRRRRFGEARPAWENDPTPPSYS